MTTHTVDNADSEYAVISAARKLYNALPGTDVPGFADEYSTIRYHAAARIATLRSGNLDDDRDGDIAPGFDGLPFHTRWGAVL